MSFITSLAIANPENKFSQLQIANFMVRAMALDDEEAQHLKILFRASGIDTRYSAIEDYGVTEEYKFFPNNKHLEPFPSTKARLQFFAQHAVALSKKSAVQCLDLIPELQRKDITHIITVSCTGMFAPGLDIALIGDLELESTVSRTSINFMGCYAAFNALRIAQSFCTQDSNAKVLIVCTELCSLHFQKEKSEDNFLANALFADGSASLLVEAQPRQKKINLRIDNFFCDLALEGEKGMAWSIGDLGFEMKLSSYIPKVIKTGIRKLTEALLRANNISLGDIEYFAIHPGGKKILEAIETEIGLSKEENYFAYSVLRKYGNMSSPTVLFVLDEIAQTLDKDDNGKKILSFGFGPGLTLESLVLTIVA